jgi:hypothetical protein
MIDHHIISNDMVPYYIAGSTAVEDPRNYISSYTSTTSDHLPVYSRYSLNQALPVVMLPLQGWLQGTTAELRWETTSEANSSHFEIERSANGRSFEVVGKVASRGNSNVRNAYSWSDVGLQPGTTYYRLRQVDRDGKYLISRTIPLRLNSSASISVYPNPVKQQLGISIPAGLKHANWKLTAADGRVLAAGSGAAENMVRSLQRQVPVLRAGWYLLQVNQQTIRLVKE